MRLRPLVALLLLVIAGQYAHAHQKKESMTRVLFNPRTGNIEVMHRFILHDVEHAGRKLFDRPLDLLKRADDGDLFQAYVLRKFGLADQNHRKIELRPVGHEVAGPHFWVYSEAAIPEGLSMLNVRYEVLLEVWPEQVNLVNVELNGDIHSRLFSINEREAEVAL